MKPGGGPVVLFFCPFRTVCRSQFITKNTGSEEEKTSFRTSDKDGKLGLYMWRDVSPSQGLLQSMSKNAGHMFIESDASSLHFEEKKRHSTTCTFIEQSLRLHRNYDN